MSTSSVKGAPSPVLTTTTSTASAAPASAAPASPPAASAPAASVALSSFADGFERVARLAWDTFVGASPPQAPPPSLADVLQPPEKAVQPLKVAVPFFTQYQEGHGFTPGDTACFRACTAMAAQSGATVAELAKRIAVATADDPRTGSVTVDPAMAKQGLDYLDAELGAGRPVVVGVSHPLSGTDAQVADKVARNADHMTDHFVVITGKGVDEAGRTYYCFNDPASVSGADTVATNRLYVGADGKLSKPAVDPNSTKTVKMAYEVTMVRRNEESL